ncbi:MAG TPA: isoprenylcysteine carboxyl methyltransferase, partial [Candidatus Rokubacteria bacterium]|nr:isoprenylcysteine carboxyl methyltransferase [Candidatus Rokubacteria bacterium]
MTTWVSVLVIGLGTILLLGVSWRSFRHSRSHGVFRFFAAEAVLGLVVLNAP